MTPYTADAIAGTDQWGRTHSEHLIIAVLYTLRIVA
jgi:hypothetical protein